MAEFKVSCVGCGQNLEVPEEMMGQDAECPSCGQSLQIPQSKSLTTESMAQTPKSTLPGTQGEYQSEHGEDKNMEIQKGDELGTNNFDNTPIPQLDWYYSMDGHRFGPIQEEQLVELIKQNKITEQSLVWSKSMSDWQTILTSKFAPLARPPGAPPQLTGALTTSGAITGGNIGKRAVSETKDASAKALKAIKILFADPIGGQSEALNELGSSSALKAGIAFIILFLISNFLLGYTLIEGVRSFARAFGTGGGVPIEIYVKLVVYSMVPSLSILVCYTAIGKMFASKTSDLSTMVFTTGVSTLPIALLFFSIKLLGLNNMELLALIGVFSLTTTILLINSSLQDVYGVSSRKSVLLTPAVLVLAAYISKVMYSALLR